MEKKTQVTAEDGKQEIFVTREFDLPLDLLFKAYADPEIIEQWMGSKVLKQENKKHGSYQLEKKDENGTVLFRANGAFHDFVPEQKIIRTFEMENVPFGIQIEFIDFEKITEDTSRVKMHIVYGSVAERDQVLKIGMGAGMNMAHNQLQKVVEKLKK